MNGAHLEFVTPQTVLQNIRKILSTVKIFAVVLTWIKAKKNHSIPLNFHVVSAHEWNRLKQFSLILF